MKSSRHPEHTPLPRRSPGQGVSELSRREANQQGYSRSVPSRSTMAMFVCTAYLARTAFVCGNSFACPTHPVPTNLDKYLQPRDLRAQSLDSKTHNHPSSPPALPCKPSITPLFPISKNTQYQHHDIQRRCPLSNPTPHPLPHHSPVHPLRLNPIRNHVRIQH